uniref:Putative extracellular protein TR9_022 n=1 Tax=Trebouxia lynnae TaxID=1825957 RepID=A0A7L9QEF5_9CHLO|nr:putative extracellular protein TR9_022 [Trebouxia lynnae]
MPYPRDCTMLLSIITFLIMPFALCAAAFDAQCGWDAHMSDSQISGRNTRRLIDISVAIHPESPSWEKSDGLGEYRELVERQDQGGLAFVSKVNLVVHTTTHFDAPSHFLQEAFDSGRGIEAMDLSIMNGPALVVEVPHDRNITAEVLSTLSIPSGTERLLFKTVSSAKKLMYHTPFLTNYTALTETGSDWVVQHGIKFVGIDYVSIATYEELTAAHQSLMRVGTGIVEGLDLSHVEPGLYDVHCLPLKLHGSEGAPGRCILLD